LSIVGFSAAAFNKASAKARLDASAPIFAAISLMSETVSSLARYI